MLIEIDAVSFLLDAGCRWRRARGSVEIRRRRAMPMMTKPCWRVTCKETAEKEISSLWHGTAVARISSAK